MPSAERTLPAPADDLFAHLADLERHWDLLPGRVQVLEADGDGALVRLRGPLGLRRTVRTRITLLRAPRELHGRARTAGGTVATVTWSLEPNGSATHVTLSADVERAAPHDRVLLVLGGNVWVRRALAQALDRLAALAARSR